MIQLQLKLAMFNHSTSSSNIQRGDFTTSFQSSQQSGFVSAALPSLCGTIVQFNLAADLWQKIATFVSIENPHLLRSLWPFTCPLAFFGNATYRIINTCTEKCCCKAHHFFSKYHPSALLFSHHFPPWSLWSSDSASMTSCETFLVGSTYRCFLADSFYPLLWAERQVRTKSIFSCRALSELHPPAA